MAFIFYSPREVRTELPFYTKSEVSTQQQSIVSNNNTIETNAQITFGRDQTQQISLDQTSFFQSIYDIQYNTISSILQYNTELYNINNIGTKSSTDSNFTSSFSYTENQSHFTTDIRIGTNFFNNQSYSIFENTSFSYITQNGGAQGNQSGSTKNEYYVTITVNNVEQITRVSETQSRTNTSAYIQNDSNATVNDLNLNSFSYSTEYSERRLENIDQYLLTYSGSSLSITYNSFSGSTIYPTSTYSTSGSFTSQNTYTSYIEYTTNRTGNRILNGYALYQEYPSSTSSAIQSSIYNGLGATKSFIGYNTSTITISNSLAVTTAINRYTVLSSSIIFLNSFLLTNTDNDTIEVTSWNGTTTTVDTVSNTITTNSVNTINETLTAGQTFLLYAQPTVLSSDYYFQKYSIVADTENREYIWTPNGNDVTNTIVNFSDGLLTSSSAITNYETYQSKLINLQNYTYQLDSDGSPVAYNNTVIYNNLGNTLTSTITTVSSFPLSLYPSITITNLSSIATRSTMSAATATSAIAINNRTNTSTRTYGTTSATDFTQYTQIQVSTTIETSKLDTLSSASFVFDGSTYVSTTYQATSQGKQTIQTSTMVHDGNVTATGSYTSFYSNGGYTSQGTSKTTNNTIYSGTEFYLPNAQIVFNAGNNIISRQALSYIGLFGQNPSTDLGQTKKLLSNIGNTGNTIIYPFKGYVGGTNIVTPIVFPVITSTVSNGTTFSYSYTSDSLLISTYNTSTNGTSEYKFSQAEITSSYAPSLITSSSTKSVALLGNNEDWSNREQIATFGPGPLKVTTELNNITSTYLTYFPYNSATTINKTSQYAFEPDLIAKNNNPDKTTSVGSTAPANYGLITFSTSA